MSRQFPRIARRPRVEPLERRELLAGLMVSTVADSGAGSLRAAIAAADATPGTATVEIDFAIDTGVQTIAPTSPLPMIVHPVYLNGASQPGYAGTPLIVLSGTHVAPGTDGLTIEEDNSTVRGLAIDSFASLPPPPGLPDSSSGGVGLLLMGVGEAVVGCYIGVDPTGKLAAGNGIGIQALETNATIGGSALGSGNVISASTGTQGSNLGSGEGDGLFLETGGVQIEGNLIGTDASGESALPNGNIGIEGAEVSGVAIGGTAAGAGNVVSGNKGGGISLGDATGLLIEGNLVGLDAAGSVALPNGGAGIVVGGGGNLIGGTTVPARNVVSGNAMAGIVVEPGARTDQFGNTIEGNYVGTDASGTRAVGNGSGLFARGLGTIGGTVAGAGNLISGNKGPGITADGFAGPGNSYGGGFTIQGNRIGTDAAGAGFLGNGTGIVLGTGLAGFPSTATTVVGGGSAAARNVISGNLGDGIDLRGPTGKTASTVISGNFIGVNASGSGVLGNGGDGINLVESIGTVLTPMPPPIGSATIGGTASGAGNVISGNGEAGIAFDTAPVSTDGPSTEYAAPVANVSVLGNAIGVDGSGLVALGNRGDGIELGFITPTTIGGTAAGAGNVIAFNGGHGVAQLPVGYPILGNSIRDNAGSPQLVSSTGQYPAPTLTTAVVDGSGLVTISGTFAASPGESVTFNFFASPGSSASNPGGQEYLGTVTATAGVDGRGSIAASLAESSLALELITATAIYPGTTATSDGYLFNFGGTSAFSTPLTAVKVATPEADLALSATVSPASPRVGEPTTYVLTVANDGPDPATHTTITYALPAGATLVSATPGLSSAIPGTVDLGTLAAHANATLTLVVTPTEKTPMVLAAKVASDLADPNPLDNRIVLTTPIARPTTPGDYDGDGRTDVAAYFPSAAVYADRPSGGGADVLQSFGVAGPGQAIPAPGDYFGDGKTDVAIYLPAFGAFAIRPNFGSPDVIVPFGIPGPGQTIPVPGDYDGSGHTEIAAYLPSLGVFVYRPATVGPDVVVPFGIPGAGQTIPAPGDYDGDGKTDVAAYFPSLGEFVYRPSGGGADVVVPFGVAGPGQTIPAPGDYDGDGKTDIAAYLPEFGSFAVRLSSGGVDVVAPFGFAGPGQTIQAPGDYDGDGRTDIAAYLPSVGVFAIRPSSGLPDVIEPFGIPGAGVTVPASALPDPNPPGMVAAASIPSSSPVAGLILPLTDDLAPALEKSKRKA